MEVGPKRPPTIFSYVNSPTTVIVVANSADIIKIAVTLIKTVCKS